MNHRGHPVRGAIAGLFLGLFLSLDLVIFGVVALDADILAVLPILGLAAGVALGLTAPLRGRSPRAPGQAQDSATPAARPPADPGPALPTPERDPSTV